MSNLLLYISISIITLALAINFSAALISMPRNSETAGSVFGLSLIGGAFIEFAILIIFLIFILSK